MTRINNYLIKPWLYILIILVGTCLKFYKINSKLFWQDEISTVLYSTGVKDNVMNNNIPPNTITSFGYYDSLLHPSTKSYSLLSEVSGILSETHLTPAHYVFLTLWYRLAGDTNNDYRLFSGFVFIASLPFVFLLAKALFNSSLSGWIAASLYAISPFIQLQAQEARYYIIWVFFSVLSNYLFLQAFRKNKTIWWGGYAIASILNIYTSAISGLIVLGHFIYVLLFKKQLKYRFIFFSVLIFLAYLPWMYFLISVHETLQNGLAWHTWFHSSFYTLDLLFFQLLGFVKSFEYLYNDLIYFSWFNVSLLPVIYVAFLFDIIVLCLIIYSIAYLFKKSTKQQKWFFILTMLPFILLFYLYDIIRNGFASFIWHYQIVNMVGIIFIVTNLFTDKIQQRKPLYAVLFFSLVILGTGSILKIAPNKCWATAPDCDCNVNTAKMIANASSPLIITDLNAGIYNFLTVLNESKNKSVSVLYCNGGLPDVMQKIGNKSFSVIYLIQSSDTLAKQAVVQFGNNVQALVKDVTPFNLQVWEIKLH